VEEWSLFTSHGLVLAAISRSVNKTTREIGDDVGITERRAHKIIVELEHTGYIKRTKVGNRNVYTINPGVRISSSLTDASIGDFLKLFGWHKTTEVKRMKIKVAAKKKEEAAGNKKEDTTGKK